MRLHSLESSCASQLVNHAAAAQCALPMLPLLPMPPPPVMVRWLQEPVAGVVPLHCQCIHCGNVTCALTELCLIRFLNPGVVLPRAVQLALQLRRHLGNNKGLAHMRCHARLHQSVQILGQNFSKIQKSPRFLRIGDTGGRAQRQTHFKQTIYSSCMHVIQRISAQQHPCATPAQAVHCAVSAEQHWRSSWRSV